MIRFFIERPPRGAPAPGLARKSNGGIKMGHNDKLRDASAMAVRPDGASMATGELQRHSAMDRWRAHRRTQKARGHSMGYWAQFSRAPSRGSRVFWAVACRTAMMTILGGISFPASAADDKAQTTLPAATKNEQ